MKEKMNVVVIGHVDHGKSTLLGRLLYDSGTISPKKLEGIKKTVEETFGKFEYAYILDTLQEEREGQMTIDIMHAWFSTGRREYTFIDCPGHHEFVKNMLTGASKAEVAILVVSAAEGVDDQTREHAFLAEFVGIKQFLVAINKMDAVGWNEKRFEQIKRDVLEVFGKIGIESYSFVPISGIEGDNIFRKSRNMTWHQQTLVESMDGFFKAPAEKKGLNLGTVQYSLSGKIVGRIESGSIRKGNEIYFEPSGQKGNIEHIYIYGKPKNVVKAGDVVELEVSGVDTGKISRGNVFGKDHSLKKRREIVGHVFVFTGLIPGKNYVIHRGTSKSNCEIKEIIEMTDARKLATTKGGDKVERSMLAKVEIVTEEPVVFEDFNKVPSLGRFIMTDLDGIVCAGKVLKMR